MQEQGQNTAPLARVAGLVATPMPLEDLKSTCCVCSRKLDYHAALARMTHQKKHDIRQVVSHPARVEAHPFLFGSVTLGAWLFRSLYFFTRFAVLFLAQWQGDGLLWQSWALLFAEACLTCQKAIFAFNLISSLLHATDLEPRPVLELDGPDVPLVDVLIPCCGEPLDVVVDTAAAAAAQDYPSDRYRVVVLDDGRSQALRAAVEALHQSLKHHGGPRVLYSSRALNKAGRSYSKAGNLQYGISETEAHPADSAAAATSEYLASLDADMIPHPLWLRRMLPHLVRDPKAALISPPQHYYNVPPGDPFGNAAEFALWFDLYEPLNDHLGGAICNGSGFVFRRAALASIGGWPLADAGEDFLCSSLLTSAGWRVLYSRDDLQRGLAPASLRAHVKQRVRWADSGLEVHRRFGYYLPGNDLCRGMSVGQRAVAMTMMCREFAPLAIVAAMALLPLALYPSSQDSASLPLDRRTHLWLQWLFLAAWAAEKVSDAVVYADVGVRGIANFQSNEIWCAPCRWALSLLLDHV